MRQHREAGPSLRTAAPAAVLGLCATLALLGASCASRPSGSGAPGGSRTVAEPLPVGSWQSDRLHCAEGRCERWYELALEGEGILSVDLYAPVGDGLPDCELFLQDADGNPLPARTGQVQSRRRLRYEAEPAVYYLRVLSKGVSDSTLDYELHAHVSPRESARKEPRPAPATTGGGRQQPAPEPPPDVPLAAQPPSAPPQAEGTGEQAPPEAPLGTEPPGEPMGPPTPPPPETPETPAARPGASWIVAEVLDVEEVSGRARTVMIEAGEPDGVEAGMEGVLVDGETEIGRIEIVEVYPTGSRARIVGVLSGPVSFDTLSRIRVPPDGE